MGRSLAHPARVETVRDKLGHELGLFQTGRRDLCHVLTVLPPGRSQLLRRPLQPLPAHGTFAQVRPVERTRHPVQFAAIEAVVLRIIDAVALRGRASENMREASPNSTPNLTRVSQAWPTGKAGIAGPSPGQGPSLNQLLR